MLKIEILANIKISPNIEDLVRNSAEKVLMTENAENCELSILLTDDDEIKELNSTYRNIDEATDVLAFAMREGDDSDPDDEMLGDVVISIPTAERQAKEYGNSVEAELALLTVHGVLHLLGYDHAERDEADLMQERQKEIVYSLGYRLDESKLSL